MSDRLYKANYREVAAKALGRKLKPNEHVHHHSDTQLVICDRQYHCELHRKMRLLGLPRVRPTFITSEVVHLRLDGELIGMIRKLAERCDRTPHNYILRILRSAAKRRRQS